MRTGYDDPRRGANQSDLLELTIKTKKLSRGHTMKYTFPILLAMMNVWAMPMAAQHMGHPGPGDESTMKAPETGDMKCKMHDGMMH